MKLFNSSIFALASTIVASNLISTVTSPKQLTVSQESAIFQNKINCINRLTTGPAHGLLVVSTSVKKLVRVPGTQAPSTIPRRGTLRTGPQHNRVNQ